MNKPKILRGRIHWFQSEVTARYEKVKTLNTKTVILEHGTGEIKPIPCVCLEGDSKGKILNINPAYLISNKVYQAFLKASKSFKFKEGDYITHTHKRSGVCAQVMKILITREHSPHYTDKYYYNYYLRYHGGCEGFLSSSIMNGQTQYMRRCSWHE